MSSASDRPPGSTTRRALIAALGASVVATAGLNLAKRTGQFEPRARVATFAAASYDINLVDLLVRGIKEFPNVVARAKGGRVVLKPNLVEWHADRPVNTDPRLIRATVDAFYKLGAKSVVVAEGPGHVRDTELLVHSSGLGSALRDVKTPFVDINVDPGRDTSLSWNFTRMDTLPIATVIMDADLVVSMPKLKTHHWAGLTLSMKNLFGTVPGNRVGWPKNVLHWGGIPRSVVDLWLAINPGFAIVDGIVAMEGDGPINGTPVAYGAILMGDQCSAVDATAARLVGVEPTAIEYLNLAAQVGGTVNEGRIERFGDRLARRDLELLPQFAHLRMPT